MFSKVEVRGEGAHPVWRFLTDKSNVTPEWNFYKYLVDHNGQVLHAYPPKVPVSDIFGDVERAVKNARKEGKKGSTLKKDLKEEL